MVAQMTQAEQGQTPFVADCYAVTKRGTAMPGRLVEVSDDGEWVTVAAPNGSEYTFHSCCMLTVEEAEEKLKQDRVDKVAGTYQFEVMRVDRSGR